MVINYCTSKIHVYPFMSIDSNHQRQANKKIIFTLKNTGFVWAIRSYTCRYGQVLTKMVMIGSHVCTVGTVQSCFAGSLTHGHC